MLERRSLSPLKHGSALIHGNHGYHLLMPVTILSILHVTFHILFTQTTLVDSYHAHFTDEKTEHEELNKSVHSRARTSAYAGSVIPGPAFYPYYAPGTVSTSSHNQGCMRTMRRELF